MSQVEGDVLVVDADLMALARIRESAQRVGREVRTATKAGVPKALEGEVAVLVLDLDRGGVELVDAVAALQPPRVLAFYSHIQENLGRASSEAGFETYPRGKFWSSLDALLT